MFIFWAIIAILIIASLLFVLPPFLKKQTGNPQLTGNKENNILIYRQQLNELQNDLENQLIDQEQYQQSQEELERRLLEDVDENIPQTAARAPSKWASLFAFVAIPVLSLGIYLNLGSPNLLSKQDIEKQTTALQNSSATHPQTQARIAEMVATLEQRLQDDPNNAEGWLMLARSYTFMQRYEKAVTTFEKAMKLSPNDARLLVDYADAVAMASDSSLEGLPMQLIKRALEIDPNNQKALWLAGTASYESGDFKAAIMVWAHLYGMLEPGSQGATTMAGNLRETRDLYLASGGDISELPDIDALLDSTPTLATGTHVQGSLSIAENLKNKVSPSDTVFIFARATSGPPMPVAIIRTTVDQLPMAFTLSDANSVMPARKISQLREVSVGARISKTGNAMPQSGDIQSERLTVTIGTEGIPLVLDQLIP